MRKLHERKKIRRIIFSKVMFFVLLIFTVFLVRAVWDAYGKYKQSQSLLNLSEDKLLELKEKEGVLGDNIYFIKTETGKEAEIVEKFNVAKEGERVVIINDLPKETVLVPEENLSWWGNVVQFFGSLF